MKNLISLPFYPNLFRRTLCWITFFSALGLCSTAWSQVRAGELWSTEHKWVDINLGDAAGASDHWPFYPHRARTATGAPLEHTLFEDPQICSACHSEIYDQWSQSMMAYSWDDPIYRGLLRMASAATQGAVDNFCTGCHTPVGLTSGQISHELIQSTEQETDPLPGVDCDSCHTMSARTGLDNGAYVLAPRDGKSVKYGPRRDAVSPYHDTEYSALHTGSSICATCHNVTHPFNNVPIERTYDEWLESPYAKEGIDCQDCHMQPFAGKAAIMGPVREDVASHRFAGGNSTVLSHLGETDQAERAREMLRSAATLEILDAPAQLAGGDTGTVIVKVTNTGAGHKLPTGFPEGREVWLDFQVTDAAGAVVYRLGAVKDGKTEPGTRNYKVHLGDAEGNEVDLEVWNVTHVLSDNRILPRGYAKEIFEFTVPPGARFPLQVQATLNYWPFSQALMDRILGEESFPVDVVEMARVVREISTAGGQTL